MVSANPDQNEIFSTIAAAKAKGRRIVFTNGCFDILHIGHIRNLQEARSLGDALVVGVNTDSSVKRLKGPTRPIFSLNARIELLMALTCVDWVLPFGDSGDDTPTHLIAQILPDVLAKGGDYALDEIAGADIILENGGQVKRLKFYHGWSTTKLISAIKRN